MYGQYQQMTHSAFYPDGTETSTGPFADWVPGVLGSPAVRNQARKGLEDAPAAMSSFEQDIDDAFRNTGDATSLWHFVCDPDQAVDWPSILNSAMLNPSPMPMDGTLSTVSSPSQAPSPHSDSTLVDSPFASFPDLESSPTGDAPVHQSVASLPTSPFNGFKFTFQCQPMAATTSSDQQYCYHRNYDYSQGQYWPGQQLPQHELGAAGVVAPGLTNIVEVNANTFAFTAIDPASITPCLLSSAELQRDPAVVKEPKPIQTGAQKKRPRTGCDVNSRSSLGESNNQEPPRPKRKRKQDTTKRYPCDFPGCDSKHSRSHNLKVHFESVHLGVRGHVCEEPGCPRAFSRKHDLIRHFQSAHTDLGSPRKSSNGKGNKGTTGCKTTKDEA